MINNNPGMVSECELKVDGEQQQQQLQPMIGEEKRRGMVCRDFLRNSCWRGAACKFQHPETQRKVTFAFCHDFQNGECRRSNSCRFIHSSVQDENYYKRTGQLPPHLLPQSQQQQQQQQLANGVGVNGASLSPRPEREPSPPNGIAPMPVPVPGPGPGPVHVCNIKHIPLSEYKRLGLVSTSPEMVQVPMEGAEEQLFGARRRMILDFEQPESKRRRTARVGGLLDDEETLVTVRGCQGFVTTTARPYMMMEEENMLLRAKLQELKRRVDDLQATNEFLLEQNAQLRLAERPTSATAGLTTVTVPAVTITNTVPAGAQMQQTAQVTPQQALVNAAIRTVTASVATVPVSIAAVSMAPVQSLPPPPPIVSIAQPQQQPQPQPEPPSAPPPPTLVSYPMMSRPVMQAPPPDLRH